MIEKFKTVMWTNHNVRKKAYYIKKFNPNCDNRKKTYLGAAIKGKSRLLVAQLRICSHHFRCEISRWSVLKKFRRRELVYSAIRVWWKQNDTLSLNVQPTNIRNQYKNSLKMDNMHQLFDEDKINQITNLLIKFHNRKSYIKKM